MPVSWVEAILWLSAGVVIYSYVGYPLLLWLARHGVRRSEVPAGPLPSISLIIPACNEEMVIADKVTNALSASYPAERLEVLVISDGSTDATDQRAAAAGGNRAVLLRLPERRGKASAMNLGAARARGSVLVFTDANVFFEPPALSHLVSPFADPGVGAAVGRVILRPEGSTEALGESMYMRYERLLHQLESDVSSMVTVDGAMFAIRRSLYEPLRAGTVVDDFVTVMRVVAKGFRIAFVPAARGHEAAAPTVRDELRRKIRIVAGGYQALLELRGLLNPFAHPLVAFQLTSHKLMRWLTPLALLAVAVANAALVRDPGYRILLGLQVGFYALALASHALPRLRANRLCYFPYYFCAMNLAALLGLGRFLRRSQSVLWEKGRA
jgi:cellulose synthase/poly-beta-1,6-N-acetylglucosamine synthase-like glycosyltransferase